MDNNQSRPKPPKLIIYEVGKTTSLKKAKREEVQLIYKNSKNK